MKVHSSNWDKLEPSEIAQIWAKNLRVNHNPSEEIIIKLRATKKATIEVLEDSRGKTIYRIREIGQIFPVGGDHHSGQVNRFDQKPIVHQTNGKNIIERLKPPRFKAIYNEQKELSEIEWLDPEPEQSKLISTLKKAIAFLKHST